MSNISLKSGTLGGTFLSILPNLNFGNFLETIFLASIGAVVSFSVSLLLKCILKKYFKK